jgi:hypothetical protein
VAKSLVIRVCIALFERLMYSYARVRQALGDRPDLWACVRAAVAHSYMPKVRRNLQIETPASPVCQLAIRCSSELAQLVDLGAYIQYWESE